jgi:hypothetical protein
MLVPFVFRRFGRCALASDICYLSIACKFAMSPETTPQLHIVAAIKRRFSGL